MNLIVSFCAPTRESRIIPLPNHQATIGRDESCDIALDHPSVSRNHALIKIIAGKNHFSVEDCGSANGTFLEGVRIDGQEILHPDQNLEIGPFRFRVCCMPERDKGRSARPKLPVMGDSTEDTVLQEAINKLPQMIHSGCAENRQEDEKALSGEVEKILYRHLIEMLPPTTPAAEVERLTKKAVTLSMGLGPLEDWLDDPEVTEIMINGTRSVYLEKNGLLQLVDSPFPDEDSIMRIVDRILFPIGRRVDSKTPYVDGRLQDGSRINVVIPPASLEGPAVTIRKFPEEKLDSKSLVKKGSLSAEAARFLEAAVKNKKNILISGGTGTGKTTLLNALASFCGGSERIITIEDAAELKLHQDHVIRLETRLANIEGQGEVTTRDLVRNSLRMRPDRIVIGECRGGEAFDMLQAMNTGHDGSMTTCHSNSPRDALKRIEAMALMAGLDIPQRVIREQIATAIQIIVQLSRVKNGRRAVTSIVEVDGYEADQILTQVLFEFSQKESMLKDTGLRATFMRTENASGISAGTLS